MKQKWIRVTVGLVIYAFAWLVVVFLAIRYPLYLSEPARELWITGKEAGTGNTVLLLFLVPVGEDREVGITMYTDRVSGACYLVPGHNFKKMIPAPQNVRIWDVEPLKR